MKNELGVRQLRLIDDLVKHFIDNQEPYKRVLISFKGIVESSKKLSEFAHSIRSRIKDPDHLKDKLIRKALEAKEKGRAFSITKKNLFAKINDLAGFRIIHLHTKQFEEIDAELKRIFIEQKWILLKGPSARTWDDESREYFTKIGIQVDKSPNMYTSVHYIIKPNSNAEITCEVQVRTLMEEVWGEVDHTINYPHKSDSISCREQIKVLARVTSSSSRLVDSIFSTHQDFEASKLKISNPMKVAANLRGRKGKK